MIRIITLLLATTLGIAACVPARQALPPNRTPPPSEAAVTYDLPNARPIPVGSIALKYDINTASATVYQTLKSLPEFSVRPTQIPGVYDVRYSGDPGFFIDCGTITFTYGDNKEPERLPASAGSATLPSLARYPSGELRRAMHLDTRTLVTVVQTTGGTSRVLVETQYVVTKAISAASKGTEAPWSQSLDRITFKSGSAMPFRIGTVCQSTGLLEQRLLSMIPGQIKKSDPS